MLTSLPAGPRVTIVTIVIIVTCAGLYKTEGDNSYNAFEKDIAVVHFFFQV